MDKYTAAEVDISAILSTYVYMDEQSTQYAGKSLDWILENMPSKVKESDNYKAVLAAVKSNPNLGSLKLVSQSMCEGSDPKLIIACTFQDSSGNLYVVYRGTGDGKWVDNGIGIANESSQMQQAANEYFDHVVESLELDTNQSGRLIVTGHSKGGNEAQYVTLNSEYGYLVDNCYSIDGQGFSQAAIDHFIDLYGEDYYYRQLNKMYSINGENDYVHDLGIVVIPEDHTYFVETPDANDMGGYHDIKNMLDGAGLNWYGVDKNGNIISAEQGPIGKFAKALSDKMQNLDQDDIEDCAITIMSFIELFMPYNGEMGGEYKVGTGDRSFMTVEEFMGFLAHGIPLLAETLLLTEEGRNIVIDAIKSGIQSIYDEYGVMGVIATGFITILLLPPILEFVGAVVIVANIIDFCIDFVNKIQDISEKVKQFVSDVKDAFVYAVNKIVAWYKSHTAGYKYANANPQITVDTYKLKNYAQRIAQVNTRISKLDSRLDSLYWSVGLRDLWNLMQADLLTGYSWRLLRCSGFLNDTASDFEKAEESIAAALS